MQVLDLGQVVAGNFAGGLLAYFGADVIKVGPLSLTSSWTRYNIVHDTFLLHLKEQPHSCTVLPSAV